MPWYDAQQNSFEASKLFPTRSKSREAIVAKTIKVDAMCFVNVNPFEITLKSPVTDERTKLREMAIVFEELFNSCYYVMGTPWVLFSGVKYVVLLSSVIQENWAPTLKLIFHQLSSHDVSSLVATVGIWYHFLKSPA